MRPHSITNPLTPEEQRAGLVDDPAALTLDDLAYWINALDHELGTLGRPLELVARLGVLRGEMKIRTDPRPVIDPPIVGTYYHRTYHLGGIICNEGESEGVLAVTANTDPSPDFPASVRIVIGAPDKSPLMEGYIPEIDGFAMSVAVAKRWVATIQAAIRDVEEATQKKESHADTQDR
jgi:hypothetical protein